MGPRLVILLFLAIGLAVFLGLRASRPAQVMEAQESEHADDLSDQEREHYRILKTDLRDFPLTCDVPPAPPELSLRWEVSSGDRHVINFYIDEAHGYYVETFWLEFFYKPTPATTQDESPLVVPHYLDNYVKANSTFDGCVYVAPAELQSIGGHMGTTDNWEGQIVRHGRYCAKNPELRARSTRTGCE